MKKYLFSFLVLFVFCTISSAFAQTIRYVKEGGSGTGTTWANASGDIQIMIDNSAAGDQVWVAKGTYLPTHIAGNGTTVRDKSFVLKKDVKIYGGFAGTETTLANRNLGITTNASILSGNLGGDKAYHVVISAGNVGTAELNGFTIKDGNANGDGIIFSGSPEPILLNQGGGIYIASSSPILTNLIISDNYAAGAGGGIFTEVGSAPKLTNVTISGNTAGSIGGGICNNSILYLENVTISGNFAPYGGGFFNGYYGEAVLVNVTISGNEGTDGSGIYNASVSETVLVNVTISGNEGSDGGGIYNASSLKIHNTLIYGNSGGILNSSSATNKITYSLVQGLTDETNGNISGDKDPLFIAPLAPGLNTGGDYRLQSASPAINTGGKNSDYVLGATDLDGNQRIQGGTVDMGAYEYIPSISPTNGIVYVTVAGSGDFSGSNWSNSYNDLQKAINATGVQQVWVAGGTYMPTHIAGNGTTDRDKSFVLKKDVKIYGGFAGTETTLANRNLGITTNASILSGDLGTIGNSTDDAYHVVISAGDVGTAELNGFTIKDGYAGETGGLIVVSSEEIDRINGGGIYIISSSPILTNLIISDNYAVGAGGGIFTEVGSAPKLTNVTISGNTAGSIGGGICNDNDRFLYLTNVTISGNYAYEGGGFYNRFGEAVLVNVTISGNDAREGGGIFNYASLKIHNTLIYGNSSGILNYSSHATTQITYSLVQGLTDETNGNISGDKDPLFIAPLAPGLNTGGDYRLQSASPAINTGKNDYVLGATDLDGNPRIQGRTVDMGAYESNVPAAIAGTISGSATVCAGINSTTVSVSDYTGIIQWQASTDNVTFNNIEGANSDTYSESNLFATTWYRAVVTSGGARDTSSIFVVTVTPNASAGTITADASSQCIGSTTTYTVSGVVLSGGNGAWSSDNEAVATVSSTGVVTSVGGGTCNIVYTVTGGCGGEQSAIKSYTVNVPPSITTTNSNPRLYFGAPGDQSSTITATANGGTAPYTITFSMDRALISDYINASGDEVWKATGTTTFDPNPTSEFTGIANGGTASINVVLLADANISMIVSDANGCSQVASVVQVLAEDARCFAGASGNVKVKVCHVSGSAKNPKREEICVSPNAVQAHLDHGDILGGCKVNVRDMNLNIAGAIEIAKQLEKEREEMLGNLEVIVLPNPSTYDFKLVLKSLSKENVKVIVTDITGRKIDQKTDVAANSTITLGDQYSPGMYIVKLIQGKDIVTVRLIKGGK